MLLNQRCEIWRTLPDRTHAGRTSVAVWRTGVACHLEPVSAIDHTVAFALESTHCIYLPVWFVGLRKLDEIRISGRITADGTRVPNRYVVKGIRRFTNFGDRHLAAYCEERD